MKKALVLFALLSMTLSACTTSSMPTQNVQLESAANSSPSPLPTESIPPAATKAPAPAIMTEQDIFDFELLRKDWTKEQMEELGLEKKVNEAAGETIYSNDYISYTYTFRGTDDALPGIIDVFGETADGPRGISVGDTFEDVMALFPQDEDWQNNTFGLFYGQFDKYKERPIGSAGYVYMNENGEKDITLTTGTYTWMRIFFQEDVVTHYTIYLIGSD